jgi:serine/threonine protein phosphatase PrpC
MVLASDGVWGWTSNEQVARLVRRKLRESNEETDPKRKSKRLEQICEELIHLAMDNGSTDNITVIVVVFNSTQQSESCK